jgi:hypothetical protein
MTTNTLWNVHMALNFLGILGLLFKVPCNPYAYIWVVIQVIILYTLYKRKWEI